MMRTFSVESVNHSKDNWRCVQNSAIFKYIFKKQQNSAIKFYTDTKIVSSVSNQFHERFYIKSYFIYEQTVPKMFQNSCQYLSFSIIVIKFECESIICL